MTEASPRSGHDEQAYMLGPHVETHDRGSERDSFECGAYQDSPSSSSGLRRAFNRVMPSMGLSQQRKSYREALPSPRLHVRSKRGCLNNYYVRLTLFFPVVILAFFGLVHLLRVHLGGDSLFFGTPGEDEFWPDWGKPGHAGEAIAHYPTDVTRDVVPIPCHSHNDYWRRIPFYEAIHYGCTGVEADVWLKGEDELYVGHSIISLSRNRTFKAMYVNPILEMLEKQNPSTEFGTSTGHGIFDEDPDQTLILLVDFKTDGAELWPVVRDHLTPLREKNYLSSWNGTHTITRAVTVVATGNAPFNLITANQTHRDIFFDAPLDRLSLNATHSLHRRGQGSEGAEDAKPEDFNPGTSFYASVSLSHAVGQIAHGKFTDEQLGIIRGQIGDARRQGLQARYWDTPAWPVGLRNYVWRTLVEEGVDVLNVDDLRGAARLDWRRHVGHDIV
ncbi:Altered inheritance of mitochondria protein 6 [Elsinoe australis]|uniref:Altered inheritance of mitochondria protein 6 n=1 Tax=Elsinoe australis TaxID=40998 RepID=A0A2P7Z7L6_9PEZI|nr:Altered inheritance of mitochondria protein 6 [Elsinoe australis]